jgi:hypothetical protein
MSMGFNFNKFTLTVRCGKSLIHGGLARPVERCSGVERGFALLVQVVDFHVARKQRLNVGV